MNKTQFVLRDGLVYIENDEQAAALIKALKPVEFNIAINVSEHLDGQAIRDAMPTQKKFSDLIRSVTNESIQNHFAAGAFKTTDQQVEELVKELNVLVIIDGEGFGVIDGPDLYTAKSFREVQTILESMKLLREAHSV